MAWKVNLVFYLTIVVSTSYKYPINNQYLWSNIEGAQENRKSYPEDQINNNKIMTPKQKANSHVEFTNQLKIPDHCKQTTYCEDIPDYPQHAINKLINETRLYISIIETRSFIKPTIDWLLNQRFPSGNFPSSMGSGSGDRLVQWCHGAPGFVPFNGQVTQH